MAYPTAIGPELTINHTDTFLVTDRSGQATDGRHGLYHRDMRYLAAYRFSFNDLEPQLLSSAAIDFHLSRSFFTNPPLGAFRTAVPRGSLVLVLDRAVDGGGLHEDWHLTNYAHGEVRFTLALGVVASFEDIFDVRARRGRARVVLARWDDAEGAVRFVFRDRDFRRSLTIRVDAPREQRARWIADRLELDLVLTPRSEWHTCVDLEFESGPRRHAVCVKDGEPARLPAHELLPLPELRSSSRELGRAWGQAHVDLTALHFERRDGAWYPAAGVPWFSAIFGRDALLAAYELVWANPSSARATLVRLAELQAAARDPYREAEPGKIPHELRVGYLAHFGRIPHTPAYTTADATLLYVVLLSETWRWTGDRALVERCLPVAERCLEWARRDGDRDADGLQEYRRSPGEPGYEQMGWKDSPDAVVDEGGRVAAPPIALVELQGYWYDALVRIVELRRVLGLPDGGALDEAESLRRAVEDRFWLESEGTYAFALDGNKRQVRAVASNAGHLLWSGAVAPERAARVAARLLAPDMWSGWGIRTLSSENPAYNPISYHRGSVWPHDCALIAEGFARYGLRDAASAVAEAIVAASARLESASLPELWSGIPRLPTEFPVLYLDANRPQAWAAAAIPSLVRTMLGLQPDAAHRRLTVAPAVPKVFGTLALERIPFLDARVSLRASGNEIEVTGVEGDVEVVRAAG